MCTSERFKNLPNSGLNPALIDSSAVGACYRFSARYGWINTQVYRQAPLLQVLAELDVEAIKPVVAARDEVRVWGTGWQAEVQWSGAGVHH